LKNPSRLRVARGATPRRPPPPPQSPSTHLAHSPRRRRRRPSHGGRRRRGAPPVFSPKIQTPPSSPSPSAPALRRQPPGRASSTPLLPLALGGCCHFAASAWPLLRAGAAPQACGGWPWLGSSDPWLRACGEFPLVLAAAPVLQLIPVGSGRGGQGTGPGPACCPSVQAGPSASRPLPARWPVPTLQPLFR
jgi:hypothetical protein